MSEVPAHAPVTPVSRGEKAAAGLLLLVYALCWLGVAPIVSPWQLLQTLGSGARFAFRRLAKGENLIDVFLAHSTQGAFGAALMLAIFPLGCFLLARLCRLRGVFGTRACWGWVGLHAALVFICFATFVFSNAGGTISAMERVAFSWIIGGSFGILLTASVMLYRTRRHE